MKFNSPIVSSEWLCNNLHQKSLIVLDASITKVGSDSTNLAKECIPKSIFFDIKEVFSDAYSIFPNTVPSPEQFTVASKKLGINENNIIVVYDNIGIYSSPRVWWLFRLMGFDNIAILDGGLPAWKLNGFKINSDYAKISNKGNFTSKLQKELLVDFEAVWNASSNKSSTIIDARPSSRFNGFEPEPRKGLRSGTIPNSINLPYEEVLDGYKYKDILSLKDLFSSKIKTDKPLIFSCGSGITACIVALASEMAGFKKYAIYDGSWTEFGTLTERSD